jgi:hypothetical protein
MAGAVDRLEAETRTRSPASSSPRRRRPSSPAATSTLLVQATKDDAPRLLREVRGDQGPAAPARDARQARSSPRSTAPRSAAAWRSRWPATTASRSSTTPRASRSACPRSPSACCPAAAASPAPCACSASRRADERAAPGPAVQARAKASRSRPRRRARRHPEELLPRPQGVDRANPEASSPGTSKGYKIPGGTPSTRSSPPFLPAFPANLRKQLKGAPTRRRGRSWPPPSRARRSTSTPRSRIESPLLHRAGRRPGLEEHDPGVLLRPAGDQRRQSVPDGIEQVAGHQGRRARRRHDGRRHRLRVRQGRHGGRAQGRLARGRREGQGYSEKLLDKGVKKGKVTQEKGDELLARITPTDDPPTWPAATSSSRRSSRPGAQAQVFAEIEPHVNAGRAALLQHLDAADHRAGRRA